MKQVTRLTNISSDKLTELYLLDKKNDENHWDIIHFSNKQTIDIILIQDKIRAFIVCQIFDDIDILRIVVDKNYRNQGLAKLLIDNLKTFKKNIFLEVREGNTIAINLYLKSGFKVINHRKNYYKDQENALIMNCKYILKPPKSTMKKS